MRQTALLLVLSFVASAQSLPTRLGDTINLIPPATNTDGNTIVFAAAVAPDGTAEKNTNLYLFTLSPFFNSIHRLTNYAGDATSAGVTGVAYAAGFAAVSALAGVPGGPEEVHLIDTSSAADRTLALDKEGCVQPLCVGCFRSCIRPVHLTADASKVLYAVARQQPFFVVNADGSGLRNLPVYAGALAPSAQRVVSSSGLVVFTSSTPFGPTFAAAPTEVYTMNLDGTGIQQVTKSGRDPYCFDGNAAISADGSLIAFESNACDHGPDQVNQVWVVRPDGTGLRQISTGREGATNPSISGDGSVVTFLQSGQVKRAHTSGDGTILTLTKLLVSAPRDAVVSEDGAEVVFTLGPPSGSPAAVYRIPTDSTSGTRDFLSVYAPRFLSTSGVSAAAGYGPPSPGSLISVYGANLTPDELTQATVFPLPESLNDLSLLVNGKPVPLLAATPWQINAQLPQTLSAGPAFFQVRYSGVVGSPFMSAEVKSFSPVNFAFPYTRGQLGYQQAAAFHAGTRLAADLDHPAAVGETIETYGLGLGMTDPAVEAGSRSPASPPARALQKPRVQIGGVDATVTFAGLTPGLAGVYQVNVIVPEGVPSGLQTLGWSGPDGTFTYSSIAVK